MIQKKLKILFEEIEAMDKTLKALYGIDSQEYLNFKDKLNELSIDDDR